MSVQCFSHHFSSYGLELTKRYCSYILDLCLLANVTIEAKIEEKVEEVEVEATGGVSEPPNAMEDEVDVTAELDEPVSEEKEEPEIPTILG